MVLRVKILNWDRYQARDKTRHKIENPSWMKLHNKILHSGVWGSSPTARCLAIGLLILTNETGSDKGEIVLPLGQLAALVRLRSGRVQAELGSLATLGFLEYQELASEVAGKVRARQDKIRIEEIAPRALEVDWGKEKISETLKKEIETPSQPKYQHAPQSTLEAIPHIAKDFINRCKGETN